MTTTNVLRAAAIGLAWSAAGAFAQPPQPRVIQPSPAYYQSGGTYYQAVPAPQPVYYVPAPPPPPPPPPVVCYPFTPGVSLVFHF